MSPPRRWAFSFIDPATGLITEPTEAQLREAEAQNPTANLLVGEAVERPGLVSGGMIADVPASLFPVVTASVGDRRQGDSQGAQRSG